MTDKRYRVVWQDRRTKRCTCCTDENHPWVAKASEILDSVEEADRFEGKLFEHDDEYHEIKGICIEVCDVSEWRHYEPWAESNGS